VENDDLVITHSRRLIEQGSKSFARASKLFQAETRDSVTMLYAWCRYCDDVVDGQHLGFHCDDASANPDSLATRVGILRTKTLEAYDGAPQELEFKALARVVEKHAIDQRYPLDLIAGFTMDAAETRYKTIEDTLAYCYHVAGCVGIMMAQVMGVRDKPTLERACDLGIAFQLTNIARDVVADKALGRVYLPADWLAREGLSPGTMAAPANRPQLFNVVDRLLRLADSYYDSASYGIARLPYRSAWAIASALRIYQAIGHDVRRKGALAWDERASTSRVRKLQIVAGASLDAAMARSVGRLRPAPPRDALWTPRVLRRDTVDEVEAA